MNVKMNGESFTGPNEALVVLIRNGNPVAFKARACLNFERFELLCPRPQPKTIVKVGGIKELLFNDPKFLDAIDYYGKIKTAYVIVESLRATPNLEWERVKSDDPTSWLEWRKELEEAFFTDSEIQKIVSCVWEANGIDDEKLEEARKRFLAGQDQESEKPT